MKIGILDQMIKNEGKNNTETVQDSIELCKISESIGYSRYWISEHHGTPVSVCPSPEIMISLLLSQTNFIEIGAGGILLNNYTPFRVAELFKLLNDISPSRVNLGIGSSYGGDIKTIEMLHDGNVPDKIKYEEKLKHLREYLNESIHDEEVKMWILGCSEKSEALSHKLNIDYCYGQFLNSSSEKSDKMHDMIAVSAICSEDPEKLKLLLRSQKIVDYYNYNNQSLSFFPDPEKYSESFDSCELRSPVIYGSPKEVGLTIRSLAQKYQAKNILILSNIHSFKDKVESYRLIKSELS